MGAPWLDDLNTAQREAVTYGEGPLLVVAGAGTGKTRIYSYTVNAQAPLSEVVDTHFPWCSGDIDAMAAIFQQYTRRKARPTVV